MRIYTQSLLASTMQLSSKIQSSSKREKIGFGSIKLLGIKDLA